MSVVAVEEKVASRSGEGRIDGSRQYVRVFIVKVNNRHDGCMTVTRTPLIPGRNSYYRTETEYDRAAFCVRQTPRQISKYLWEVTCTYEAKPGDQDNNNPNPFRRPPVIRRGKITYREPYRKDAAGKSTYASNGQAYDPLPERDATRTIVTVSRAEASYNDGLWDEYTDVVNSDRFLGKPAKFWKFNGVDAELQYEEEFTYWWVTYELHGNKKLWLDRLQDTGTYWLEPGDEEGDPPKRVHPTDKDGNATTETVYLDGEGGHLVYFSEPKENEFQPYEAKPFSRLLRL